MFALLRDGKEVASGFKTVKEAYKAAADAGATIYINHKLELVFGYEVRPVPDPAGQTQAHRQEKTA